MDWVERGEVLVEEALRREFIEKSGFIDCENGPIRPLSPDHIRTIIDRVATLGVTIRPQHDTLDVPTDVFITGANRYLLERDNEIVHTSEFGLGDVYCDPSGQHGARCDAGHHVYVEMGLTAMRTTAPSIRVEVPEIGTNWMASPFRASTREQADWLGTNVRPFTQALALHTERRRRPTPNDHRPEDGPVVIARHDTPPERFPDLRWHRRGDPTPLRPQAHRRGYPADPDSFTPKTFNDVIDEWRVRRPHGVQRGYNGVVPRPAVHALRPSVLIGKEGDQLAERERGTTTTDAAIVIYDDGTPIDPTWERIPKILNLLGPNELARQFPDIPDRTRRNWQTGRSPAASTRQRVIEHLRHEAIRALAQVHRKRVPDDDIALFAAYAELLDAQRHTTHRCGTCRSPLRGDQTKWCSDRCRTQARRAARHDSVEHPDATSPHSRNTPRRDHRPIHTMTDLQDAITAAIEHVGWPRARPIIMNALGPANGGPHGRWRHQIDHLCGRRIINELHQLAPQDVSVHTEEAGTDASRLDLDNLVQ